MSSRMGTTKTKSAASSTDLTSLLARGLTEVMMVTVESAGQGPFVGPLQIAELDDDGSVWFFAPVDCRRWYGSRRCSATSQTGTRFMRADGRVEIVADREALEERAEEMEDTGRFPVAASKTVLLRFIPEAIDYWDTASARGTAPLMTARTSPSVSGVHARHNRSAA
jgi:hypothetical protein